MKLKFLLFFLLSFCYKGNGQTDAQLEVKYSPSVINYEVARNYKLLGDEIFLEASLKDDNSKLSVAKENYLIASSIINDREKIDLTTLKNSNYLGDAEAGRLYFDLLKTDIEYRLTLLDAGIDFFGLEYANKLLFPSTRLERFKLSYNNLATLYEKIRDKLRLQGDIRAELFDNVTTITSNSIREKISQITTEQEESKETYFANKIQRDTIKRNELQKRQTEVMNEIGNLAQETSAIEKELVNAVGKLVYDQLGIAPIENIKSIVEEGKINPETVSNLLGKEFSFLKEMPDFVPKVIEAGKILKDNEDAIKSFFDDPSVAGLSVIIEGTFPDNEKFAGIKKYAAISLKVINIGDGAMKCVKEEFNYECSSEVVNRIIANGLIKDEDLIKQWKSADKVMKDIDVDEVVANVISLIDSGKIEYVLPILDGLAQADPSLANLTPDLVELYKNGESVYNIAKNAKNLKTFEDYLEFGKALVEQGAVTVGTFKGIVEEVKKEKPLGLFFEYATKEDSPLLHEICCQLSQNGLRNKDLKNIHKTNFLALTTATELPDDLKVELYQLLVIEFPAAFYYLLDKEQQAQIETIIGEPLTLNSFPSNWVSKIEKSGSAYKFNTATLPDLMDLNLAARNEAHLSTDKSLIPFTELVVLNINRLQSEIIDKYNLNELLDEISEEDKNKLFDSLVKKSPKSSVDDFFTIAAHTTLGASAFLGDTINDNSELNVVNSAREQAILEMAHDSDLEGTSNKFTEQAILAAISKANPIVGASLKIVSLYSDLFNKVKQLNAQTKDAKILEERILELRDEIPEAILNLQLAAKEKEKTQLSIDLLEHQTSRLSLKFRGLAGDVEEEEKVEMENLLQSYYYWSELVRQDFALLNKSVKFWYQKSFYQIVYEDNTFRRLALDPDIRLYEWLKLDATGQRTNISQTFWQWEKINNIISSLESKIKVFDFENTTITIDIIEEIVKKDSELLSRFTAWQKNPSTKFEIPFIIEPSIYFSEQIKEARIASANIGLLKKGNSKLLRLENAKLKPDSYSILVQSDFTLRKEPIPHEVDIEGFALGGGIFLSEDDFNQTFFLNYKQRWLGINGFEQKELIPEKFEGIGLYSSWTLVLERGFKKPEEIEEIRLSIGYLYPKTLEEKDRCPDISNPIYHNNTFSYIKEFAKDSISGDAQKFNVIALWTPKDLSTMHLSLQEFTQLIEDRGNQYEIINKSVADADNYLPLCEPEENFTSNSTSRNRAAARTNGDKKSLKKRSIIAKPIRSIDLN